MIGLVPPEAIDQVMPKVAPLIERALAYNHEGLTIAGVMSKLHNGDAGLLIEKGFKNGCVLAVEPPIMTIELFAGELFDRSSSVPEEWVDVLINVAHDLNCDRIRIYGRPGWLKKLKHLDFNHIYTILEKRV